MSLFSPPDVPVDRPVLALFGRMQGEPAGPRRLRRRGASRAGDFPSVPLIRGCPPRRGRASRLSRPSSPSAFSLPPFLPHDQASPCFPVHLPSFCLRQAQRGSLLRSSPARAPATRCLCHCSLEPVLAWPSVSVSGLAAPPLPPLGSPAQHALRPPTTRQSRPFCPSLQSSREQRSLDLTRFSYRPPLRLLLPPPRLHSR